MDNSNFDAVARAVAAGASRRQVLRLLAIGTVTAWLPGRAGAAPARQACAAAGLTDCGTGCVDVSSDPFNCGGCGIVCESGVCTSAVCAEPTPTTPAATSTTTPATPAAPAPTSTPPTDGAATGTPKPRRDRSSPAQGAGSESSPADTAPGSAKQDKAKQAKAEQAKQAVAEQAKEAKVKKAAATKGSESVLPGRSTRRRGSGRSSTATVGRTSTHHPPTMGRTTRSSPSTLPSAAQRMSMWRTARASWARSQRMAARTVTNHAWDTEATRGQLSSRRSTARWPGRRRRPPPAGASGSTSRVTPATAWRCPTSRGTRSLGSR